MSYGAVQDEASTEGGRQLGGGDQRILIVEDDYFVSLMLEEALLASGYSLLGPVDTGEEAVELAMKERPDLVLMDVRLAGALDGVDTAIAIRQAGIPSIFITGHSDPEIKRRGEEASPCGWILKPFSASQLLTAIGACLA
jgi:DNA-binding response OmpR family regulator